METFLEYWVSQQTKERKRKEKNKGGDRRTSKSHHHKNSSRLYSRNGELDDNGKHKGTNMVAKHLIDKNDPNYQVEIKTGPITTFEADKLIEKHGIKKFPAQLGKREYKLVRHIKTNKQGKKIVSYSIADIQKTTNYEPKKMKPTGMMNFLKV